MRRLAIIVFAVTCTAPALAATGESSFTPTSIRVTLSRVSLVDSKAGRQADVYSCGTSVDGGVSDDGGAADCVVDIADDAALQRLFDGGGVPVPLGTYDQVSIDNCSDGASGYVAEVKGSVVLAGTTYYTAGNTKVLSANPADADYVTLAYDGCGTRYDLSQPLDLKAGDSVDVSAFFSIKDVAYALLAGSNLPSGCAQVDPNAASPSVCMGYPSIVPYVGSVAPSVETYFITEDLNDTSAAKAGGQLLLLVDGAANILGGFCRQLFSETSVPPSVSYVTALASFVENAVDGGPETWTLQSFGGVQFGMPVDYYVKFPAFERMTHTGALIKPDKVTMVPYRAVRQ